MSKKMSKKKIRNYWDLRVLTVEVSVKVSHQKIRKKNVMKNVKRRIRVENVLHFEIK